MHSKLYATVYCFVHLDGIDVTPVMAHVTAPTPMLQRRTLQKQISISPPLEQLGGRFRA